MERFVDRGIHTSSSIIQLIATFTQEFYVPMTANCTRVIERITLLLRDAFQRDFDDVCSVPLEGGESEFPSTMSSAREKILKLLHDLDSTEDYNDISVILDIIRAEHAYITCGCIGKDIVDSLGRRLDSLPRLNHCFETHEAWLFFTERLQNCDYGGEPSPGKYYIDTALGDMVTYRLCNLVSGKDIGDTVKAWSAWVLSGRFRRFMQDFIKGMALLASSGPVSSALESRWNTIELYLDCIYKVETEVHNYLTDRIGRADWLDDMEFAEILGHAASIPMVVEASYLVAKRFWPALEVPPLLACPRLQLARVKAANERFEIRPEQ